MIVADSGGENIVGWDLLVAYDPTAFDFIRAESNIDDFEIYTFKRSDYLSITAVKSLESEASSVFKNTIVASLVFQPKKTGQFAITLKDSLGKEKSNLINDKTQKINPQLNSLTLSIY